MRAAPPAVDVPLGSGLRERIAVALFYAVAAAAFVAWVMPWVGLALPPAAVVGAGVLAAGGGWFVLPPLRGRLVWDGAGWRHLPDGAANHQPVEAVHLQMDLGHWLLLRVLRSGVQTSAWCGITETQAGGAWHALRLALYYRAPQSLRSSGAR